MTREAAEKALAEWREQINALDRGMVELLNERTRMVEEIGRIKREAGMRIYEPKREEDVLRNVAEHNTGPMAQDAARRIFERIIDEMRKLQRQRMEAARDGETS
jgi:chorismate mutase/prephenate dehydratase